MSYIKSHNYKPRYEFHKICNEDELYMGVELEVDMGGESEENAKQVLDILNDNGETNAYCMHDGSLNGGSVRGNYYASATGFEIATMPCTLEYHKNIPYEKAFKLLVEQGYKSHDTKTCGMHIHINRTFFGSDKLTQDLNISKLMFLFEKYWNEVVIIARRDSNSYARRSFLEDDESVIDLYSKSKSKGKYAVINLEHKDTVEIRIFKGTLNYNTYICTLEFVHNICKIVKEVDIYNIQMVKWTDIENIFSDELKKYIEDRKEIEKTKKEEKEKVVEQYISSNWVVERGHDFSYEIIGRFENAISLIGNNEPQRMITIDPAAEYTLRFDTPTEERQVEESYADALRKKIKKLRRQITRARNELEKLTLRRCLAELEHDLVELNRNSR